MQKIAFYNLAIFSFQLYAEGLRKKTGYSWLIVCLPPQSLYFSYKNNFEEVNNYSSMQRFVLVKSRVQVE